MDDLEPFDPAPFLVSAQSQQELLDDAFASGNAAYIAGAFAIIARARNIAAGTTEGVGQSDPIGATAGTAQEEVRLVDVLELARSLGVSISAKIGAVDPEARSA